MPPVSFWIEELIVSWLVLRHTVAREGWANWGNQAPAADNDDGLDIPEFLRGEAAANGGEHHRARHRARVAGPHGLARLRIVPG